VVGDRQDQEEVERWEIEEVGVQPGLAEREVGAFRLDWSGEIGGEEESGVRVAAEKRGLGYQKVLIGIHREYYRFGF